MRSGLKSSLVDAIIGNLAEVKLTEQARAILTVLRNSPKPMMHRDIVRAIPEPWHEEKSRFKASVSSHLAQLRKTGLVRFDEKRFEGVYVGRYRQFDRVERHWYAVPRQYHAGGVIQAGQPVGIVGDKVFPIYAQQPSRLHRPGREHVAMQKITVVINVNGDEPRWRPPHTPNTVQMLEDIDRIEETPASRHNRIVAQMQRLTFETFGDFDRHMAGAIRG